MKLKTKIYLDNFFGLPAVTFLNLFIKPLLLLRKRNEPDFSSVKRIAVCKFMGMGTIIQSTPLLMTIKKRYPGAELVFITLQKNAELIKTFPFIDKVLIIDDRSFPVLIISILKFVITQWIRKIDFMLDLEVHSYFSKIITALSLPKYKFGFYKKEADIRLGIYSKMTFYNTKAPIYKIYLQTAHFFDCHEINCRLYNWNRITKEDPSSLLLELMGNARSKKPYFIINPNASDLRRERKWDYGNFIDLTNMILSHYPALTIILTGSKEEVQYVDMIYNGINEEFRTRVINSSGKLPLRELITLINGCSIMITNDSGPTHIALALGIKTIALFGPCPPQDSNEFPEVCFIYKNLYCSPCVHHFVISPCRGDNRCMKMIRSDEVMKVVCEVMENNPQLGHNYLNDKIIYDSMDDGPAFGTVERR